MLGRVLGLSACNRQLFRGRQKTRDGNTVMNNEDLVPELRELTMFQGEQTRILPHSPHTELPTEGVLFTQSSLYHDLKKIFFCMDLQRINFRPPCV